jgi:hypothetical protein
MDFKIVSLNKYPRFLPVMKPVDGIALERNSYKPKNPNTFHTQSLKEHGGHC